VEARGEAGNSRREAGHGSEARKRPDWGEPGQVAEPKTDRAGEQSTGERKYQVGTIDPGMGVPQGATVVGEGKADTRLRLRWEAVTRRARKR
jgi:hypothetical protein